MPLVRKRRAPQADNDGSDDENQGPGSAATPRRRPLDSPPFPDSTIDDDDPNESHGGDEHRGQMVKRLIRYALACEYGRQAIKRSDINTKVLGPHSKQFKVVFKEAQLQLRWIFGMEMTELPMREKVTISQRRAAQKSESSGAAVSNAWILTSTLPHSYRIPSIVPPPMVPTADIEASYVGLYTFIISLIFLAGGQLPEGKLERYLARANADQSTPVDRTDKMLHRMVKEGYIVRIKENADGEEMIDYRVGPRGRVEVGEDGVAAMVKRVYGDSATDDLEKRIQRSLGLADLGRASQRNDDEADTGDRKSRPGRPRKAAREEQDD